MTTATNPTLIYRSALAWASGLIKNTDATQLSLPTPCSEWNVEELIGHMVATVERATAIGQGLDPFAVPSIVTDLDPAAMNARFEQAITGLWKVWENEDLLAATVKVPWGTVTGSQALSGYAREIAVHGWDLATATGQPSEAPAETVPTLLAEAVAQLPADARGGPIPFGPVVTPPPTATPTEQLVSWFGRQV